MCMYVCMYAYMCMYICIKSFHTQPNTHTHTHPSYIYIYIYILTHTHTHKNTYIKVDILSTWKPEAEYYCKSTTLQSVTILIHYLIM